MQLNRHAEPVPREVPELLAGLSRAAVTHRPHAQLLEGGASAIELPGFDQHVDIATGGSPSVAVQPLAWLIPLSSTQSIPS